MCFYKMAQILKSWNVKFKYTGLHPIIEVQYNPTS